jgi:hypothetical protein
MTNWTPEELDRQCKDNPSLAKANGIIAPVAKSCKGQGSKQNNHTQDGIKPLSQIITNKYHAVKTEIDGIIFDSKKEAERYQELCLLQKANEVFCLCCHVRFPLPGNIYYELDYFYLDNKLIPHYEEVKGYWNNSAKLKRKLFEDKYGIKLEIL